MAVRSGRKLKFKFKWTKELIFLIAGLVIMIVATILLALPSDSEKIYKKYTEAGATLDVEHVYKSINYKKLKSKIQSQGTDDVFYVFYGSVACTSCVTEIQTINTAAKAFEVDQVLYFDATFIDEEEDLDSAEFLAGIDTMEVELEGVDLLQYPALWVFKGGKLTFTTEELKLTPEATTIEGTWKLASYKVFGTTW